MSEFQNIKRLIQNNELEIAIDLIMKLVNEIGYDNYISEAILYSARYNQNEKSYLGGLIEDRRYTSERTRITMWMNGFLNRIEKELNDPFYHEFIFRDGKFDSLDDFLKRSQNSSVELKKDDVSKQKILFLSANPTDSGRLQVGKEFREINEAMRNNKYYNLLLPELALTKKNLITAMSHKPQIIHFAGHGKQKSNSPRREGVIIVTNENNKKELEMSTRAFMMQFKQYKNDMKLIVLNACYSAIQAKEFSKIGVHVIGMNNKIKDTTSLDFATGLYTGLSLGKSIKNVFYDAMTMIDDSEADLPEIWKDGEKLDL